MAAGAAAGLLLLYPLRFALLPFVVAAGVALIATPAVEWLADRLRCRRWVAAAIVFVSLLAVLAGLGWWMKAVVLSDAAELTQDLPGMLRKILAEAAGADHFRLFGRDFTAEGVSAATSAAARDATGGLGPALSAALGTVLGFILTLSVLCYFLLSGPTLARGVLWLFPPWLRPQVAAVATEVKPFLFRYVVGMVTVIAMTCALSWVGLGPLLHLPHAVVLALMVGLLEFIPVVGAFASAALIALAALSQGNLATVAGAAATVLVLRLLIDQVVAPIIFGKASSLHPAVILFAMLVGGTLYGILGLLVAVPAVATIKVILRRCYDAPDRAGNGWPANGVRGRDDVEESQSESQWHGERDGAERITR